MPSSRKLPPPVLLMSPGDLERESARDFGRGTGELLADQDPESVGLLVREPDLFDLDLVTLVRHLRSVCADLWIGVHDSLHVAASLPVQAAHLGFRSLRAPDARKALSPEVALGASLHAGDDSQLAQDLDYACLSPVYPTPYKPHPMPPLGWEGFARECARFELPLWALGGLAPKDASAAREHGAQGVLLRSGVLGHDDCRVRLAETLTSWGIEA